MKKASADRIADAVFRYFADANIIDEKRIPDETRAHIRHELSQKILKVGEAEGL